MDYVAMEKELAVQKAQIMSALWHARALGYSISDVREWIDQIKWSVK